MVQNLISSSDMPRGYSHQVSSKLAQEFWLKWVHKIRDGRPDGQTDRDTDGQTDSTKSICLPRWGGRHNYSVLLWCILGQILSLSFCTNTMSCWRPVAIYFNEYGINCIVDLMSSYPVSTKTNILALHSRIYRYLTNKDVLNSKTDICLTGCML